MEKTVMPIGKFHQKDFNCWVTKPPEFDEKLRLWKVTIIPYAEYPNDLHEPERLVMVSGNFIFEYGSPENAIRVRLDAYDAMIAEEKECGYYVEDIW